MTGGSRVTLRVERELLRIRGGFLAGVDEVGRGAIAGPVSVGVVVVDSDIAAAPAGVRDSKLLSAKARQELIEPIMRWARAWGVGHSSAAEVDQLGIIGALRCAGHRALALAQGQLQDQVGTILLDGHHDWFTSPDAGTLFESDVPLPQVTTRVKADMSCASVAAASVLAKVERDRIMCELSAGDPDFKWDENKGYASPSHIEALGRSGPSRHHRVSWHLPTAPRSR